MGVNQRWMYKAEVLLPLYFYQTPETHPKQQNQQLKVGMNFALYA